MIPGEQRFLLAKLIADVIGRVARRVNAFDRPAIALDDIAVADLNVGDEIPVAALLHRNSLLVFAGTVGAVGVGRCTGRLFVDGWESFKTLLSLTVYHGRMADVKRMRALGSTAPRSRSLARRTGTGPIPVRISRSGP